MGALSNNGQQAIDPLGAVLMTVTPGGWWEFEKLNCCRILDESVLPALDPGARRISPSLSRAGDERLAALTGHASAELYVRHLIFARLLLPSDSRMAQRAGLAQTGADCAGLACALELYRRQHGRFPAGLGELEPAFIQKLPHDIISGESLKYHATEDGQYVLYSVGWNEKDDGGATAVPKPAQDNTVSEGDWVWRLPEGFGG